MTGLCASAANAQTFSTGFEAPDYTAGDALRGQAGWTVGSGTHGGYMVEDTFSLSGNQAARAVHPAPGSTSTIHSTSRPFAADPGNNIFEMSAWFFMDSASQPGRYVGMQMGSSTGFAGGIQLGMGIDGAGELRAGTSYTGAGIFGAGAVQDAGRRDDIVDRWILMSLTANLDTGDGQVTWSNLGTSAGSDTVSAMFNRDFSAFATIGLINDFSTTSGAVTSVWVDDFFARAIPAPGAAALFGMAGLACLRRRR
ncbi:MAG: hypothetical protein EA376_05045 [Phycisphaeraceae bacterium]|nr:MAG: hypothetical protein EA376_05045 [Phycisphaeraceae bacterium]